MLTHAISPYKSGPAYQQHGVVVFTRKNKHEYTEYIDKLPFKVGDLIVSKLLVINKDTSKNALFCVEMIQEIHFSAEYENAEPKCLFVKSVHGGHNFWTIPTRWRVATKEEVEQLNANA